MNKQNFELSIFWWIIFVAVCVGLWVVSHPQALMDAIRFLESL